MRKLASVQKIAEVAPIAGADKICKYRINGWWVIDSVDKYSVGDKVVYCEPDSFLPIKPEFEFLRKSCYKKLSDGKEGFRLRTIKLRGQLSQGLIMPLDFDAPEGVDVSEQLGVELFEPPIPASLSGLVKGNFPSFLNRTDEERIQNLTDVYDIWREELSFYVTEKLDGSSMTCYNLNGEFGVCSRRMDLKETSDNAFWIAAKNHDIMNKLPKNIAIQGELIGPNVQGNPYKRKSLEMHVFNVYDISNGYYYDYFGLQHFCEDNGLFHVPIIEKYFKLPKSVDELLTMAEGKSILNKETEREGFVIRSHDRRISFKVISNKFLLKNGA